jgi:hypothetical protein
MEMELGFKIMISRYSMMKESSVIDTGDNESYPDPLSFSYQDFIYSQPPIILEPTDQLQQKPYILTNAYYSQAAYDDIVLDINNIPHLGLLFNYESVKFPVSEDLTSFINKAGK